MEMIGRGRRSVSSGPIEGGVNGQEIGRMDAVSRKQRVDARHFGLTVFVDD